MKRFETNPVDYDKTCRYYKFDITRIRQVDELGNVIVGGDFLIDIEPEGVDAFSDEKLSVMYTQHIKSKRA